MHHQILRRGFTLIELLVVIGIISVLIALLIPAAKRVREQAISIRCLSNLRQVGVGISLYATAFNGVLPNEPHYKNGKGRTWRQFLIGPASDITNIAYINNGRILYCPKNNARVPGSYGMVHIQHDGEAGTGPKVRFTTTTDEWKPFTGMKVFMVNQPSNYALIADTSFSDGTEVPTYYPDTGSSIFRVDRSNSGSIGRNQALWMAHYNNTANVLFVDGHAENCNADRLMQTANSNYNDGKGRRGISHWKDNKFQTVDRTLP